MNYKQRMIMELLDLKEKIIKLEKFDGTRTEHEDQILKKQLEAMDGYYMCLYERIMIMLDDCQKVANRE